MHFRSIATFTLQLRSRATVTQSQSYTVAGRLFKRRSSLCAPEGNRQRHAPAACGGRTAPKHTGLVSRRVLLPNNTEIKIIDHSAIAQHNQHHADRTHSPGRQEPYARRGARAQPYVETTMRPQSPGLSLTISAIQMRFLSSVVASVKPN